MSTTTNPTNTTASHPDRASDGSEVRPAEAGELRAELSVARQLVPVNWPLASLVAANPLRSFEHLTFADACVESVRWFNGNTYQSLDWYRTLAAVEQLSERRLRHAVFDVVNELAQCMPLRSDAVTATSLDVVVADLLYGPTGADRPDQPQPWIEQVVDHVGAWCAAFLDEHHAAWVMPDRSAGFYTAWRRSARFDRRLRRLVGRDGVAFIDQLPDDPAEALAISLTTLGVSADARVDALRALLMRMPGWSGLARWVDEWAPPGGMQIDLHVIDVAAALAALDAAAGRRVLSAPPGPSSSEASDTELLAERVAAVAAHLAIDDAEGRAFVEQVLSAPALPDRRHLWLVAHERLVRDRLLGALSKTDHGNPPGRPHAQVVMCIDVRSEVFRRHLEALGEYETYGFAGFFGIPIGYRPDGADQHEARCPVLIHPRHEIAELPADPDAARAAQRRDGGVAEAQHVTKANVGAPFAFAEFAGWFKGVTAAVKTFGRRRAASSTQATTPSPLGVRAEAVDLGGILPEERANYAMAIVSTIGMRRFAPIVVLCGHSSHTVNNPHAASLDCGACGGAPGGVNARVGAAIMNDPDVRAELAGAGIPIPDDTVFVAAEHDTATDVITMFDVDDVPASHGAALEALCHDLSAATARTAEERTVRLPGRSTPQQRSVDWAEVRPEWGLAGCAAFIAAPRSASIGLDLGGQTFLHSYDAQTDPEGAALETIMTAPLVVAQWISSQYYFSTVDPDVFGAGDKMVHNVVAGIGVLRGESGDLAVGLPWQSVGVGDDVEHQPVRLLAVIQAPLERIEEIIARNPGVRDLVDNEWIHVAARADGAEPWMLRTPGGTWTTWHDVEQVAAVGTVHGA